MKNSVLIALLVLTSITSCSSDDNLSDDLSQEEQAQNLSEIFLEIENLSLSVVCENSADWTFTSYGTRPCGGPAGFIAYSLNIDVNLFLELIEEHREKQQEFNEKWEIVGICIVPQQPTGVICENGSPVFEF